MNHDNAILTKAVRRCRCIGAEILPQGGTHFRVWAPGKDRVRVVLCENVQQRSAEFSLQLEEDGYYAGWVADATAGTLYGFLIDAQSELLPDPASRFQPHGPSGPSQVINPGQFLWSDATWRGVCRERQVIYELHFGTFTPEGTYAAAAEQLGELAELGVTVIEVMPVAEFAGRFGWGYDGVCLFAPTRLYGSPDDLRRFIDRAHGHGLGVILDVVYNHFGPEGQTLNLFSDYYFSDRHATDWGRGLNFDGPKSAEVRRFVLANAACWIEEFHLDGLRFDATQDIHDSSEEHILAALARQVRASAGKRATLLVAENEPQHARFSPPSEPGRLRHRRGLERRLPPHRAVALSGAARPTTATIAARPRNSFLQSSTAIFSRANGINGRRNDVARPHWTCLRPLLSTISRTMTRLPTPSAASAATPSAAPECIGP